MKPLSLSARLSARLELSRVSSKLPSSSSRAIPGYSLCALIGQRLRCWVRRLAKRYFVYANSSACGPWLALLRFVQPSLMLAMRLPPMLLGNANELVYHFGTCEVYTPSPLPDRVSLLTRV